MDQYMNWENHINHVIKKISRALGMIRHAKIFLPLTTLQTMYKSIVQPYFRFCCPVWGSCGVTALSKRQTLQNCAARLMTDSSYKTSASPFIEKLGWLTVNDFIETETLKMVYKSKHFQLAPKYLNSMFIKLSEFRNRQLHDSDTNLYVPLLKSACGQKSFSSRGAKLMNSQQTEVKKGKSLIQFVNLLKNHRP